MTLKETASKYLSKGWPIIPINPTSKKPCLESWSEYQKRLPTIDEINDWWSKWPWASLGLVTGKISGVSVIDVDPRHGGLTEDLLETVKALTGGGGWHYLYKYTDKCHSQNGIEPGIDLKSDGGYIIIAPSVHASGNKYKWIIPPFVNELAELPGRFLNNSRGSKFDPGVLKGVPEGERNESAASVIGKILGKFPEGEWISTCWDLVKGWNLKNQPPLDEQELWAVFQSIAGKEKTSRNKLEDTPETPKTPWPSPMAEEAFVGLAGGVVKIIEPHSESDRIALLMNFLTGFGSLIGDKAHFRVEADKHPMRLFSVLVGESSRGRKGTSWGYIRNLLIAVDPEWGKRVVGGGLSSGEGLIWAVRDKIIKRQPVKEHGRVVDYEEVIEDPGIEDKRLLIVEAELSSTLRVLGREGNILSALVRNAWDSGNLQTLTKNSPAQATGAHIAIIGHVTKDELLRYLTATETANGFGNRFIWLCVKRSKTLPRGGNITNVNFGPLVNQLASVVTFAKDAIEITWADETIPLWDKLYVDLTEEEPGLIGSITARSEAYVTRIACIYALLDKSTQIKILHLKAAIAIWDYARASTEFIFQGRSGDPLANRIIEVLTNNPQRLTKTDIYNHFGRNIPSDQISVSLESLEKTSQITSETLQTDGRPKTLFALNTFNAYQYSNKNYLKKLNQYINELGIKEEVVGTNISEQDYAKNAKNEKSLNNPTSQLLPEEREEFDKSYQGLTKNFDDADKRDKAAELPEEVKEILSE